MIIVDNAILLLRTLGVGLILLLLLSITSVIFVVLTICGHRHVPCPASTKDTMKRPTWLYRGFTSYEQTERLRSTLLVKKILCLVSQSGSVGRHVAMTLPENNSADLNKPYAETCLFLSPHVAMQKGNTTKRPTWLCRSFTSYEQTEWLRNSLLVKGIPCLV